MTYPFPAYDHVHISERETAHRWPTGEDDPEGWEDCLFTSAVELARFGGLRIPASLTEAEALRAASGVSPMGPSNMGKLAIGLEKRYGISFSAGWGEAQLLALQPGEAALVAGSLAHFPRGHTLRRWDPMYDAGHGLVLYRVDDSPRFWWCDPLAPSSYPGQFVSDAQASQFMYNGSLFNHASLGQFAEDDGMLVPFVDARSREIDLPAGTVLHDPGDGKAIRTLTAPATVISPYIIDATWRAAFASIDGKPVMVKVRKDAVSATRYTDEVTTLITNSRASGFADAKGKAGALAIVHQKALDDMKP